MYEMLPPPLEAASPASPLGQPQPLIIQNKHDHNLKQLQNQQSSPSPSPPSSSPPPYLNPASALPPKSRSRVAFDLNATRRYSSAPYSLNTTTTKYTPEKYTPEKQTRHISLSLANSAPEADAYMPTGRPRGESDLGRPSQLRGSSQNGYGFSTTKGINGLVGSGGQNRSLRHALPTELLTAILLPLPYLLSSLLNAPEMRTNHAKHSTNLEAAEEILEEVASTALPVPTSSSSLIHACALTAGTLLLVGLIGRIIHDTAAADKRSKPQDVSTSSASVSRTISVQNLRRLLLRMVGVGLPFLATVEIGGVRTGMILLCAVTAGLISPDSRAGDQTNFKTWKRALTTRKWTCLVFVLSLIADVLWLRTDAEPANMVRGYVALGKSILFLQPPLPSSTPRNSKLTTSLARSQSLTSIAGAGSGVSGWEASHAMKEHSLVSPLICSSEDINYTLVAGAVLGTATVAMSAVLNVAPSISYAALMISSASIGSAAALYFLAQPLALRSRQLTGTALGLSLCAVFGLVYGVRASLFRPTLLVAAALCYIALRTDLRLWSNSSQPQHTSDHSRDHEHTTHTKKTHDHEHTRIEVSKITKYFLHISEGYPTLHSILLDSESRHIVYFMSINFTFMFIQAVWAYLSGSLGLLSDTIHMFFDCVGLIVGLVAAVMSKWPPSVRFPYGYGRVETLSGLGNGIFLMFVSVEFMYGSIERIFDGVKLQRVEELLVVSTMGLIVNLIGLKFVGHHHHGHDHGHDHGHHSHSHAPQVDISHSGKGHHRSTSLTHHHEGHSSENMAGIYLHVLADTMGSAAVIVSSALTLWTGASYWDPIASFIIAGLIIAASLPLVMGSAKKLLLTIPSDVEFRVRDVLSEVSGLRGVAGYSVPRFWIEEAGGDVEAHDHHGHSHDHKHDHGHTHDHKHDEKCKDVHEHTHNHDHDHAQNGHSHHSSYSHSHDNNQHDHSHATPQQSRNVSHTSNRTTSLASSPGTPPPLPITPLTLHSHDSSPKISGVIHIMAAVTADLEDVRRRVESFLKERNMDVLVHVDREGAGRCWCGGDARGRERQVSVVM